MTSSLAHHDVNHSNHSQSDHHLQFSSQSDHYLQFSSQSDHYLQFGEESCKSNSMLLCSTDDIKIEVSDCCSDTENSLTDSLSISYTSRASDTFEQSDVLKDATNQLDYMPVLAPKLSVSTLASSFEHINVDELDSSDEHTNQSNSMSNPQLPVDLRPPKELLRRRSSPCFNRPLSRERTFFSFHERRGSYLSAEAITRGRYAILYLFIKYFYIFTFFYLFIYPLSGGQVHFAL